MAELAKTPFEKREEKYVILNGLPRHGTCHYFLIDVYSNRLLPCQLDGLDESNVAAMGAYSKEGLREAKKALTPELATAMRQADRLRKQVGKHVVRVTKYDYSAEIIEVNNAD